ncbi:LacI family DNA-binding transcriptional regulator [Geminisphaera colitermitum]|uniref:LacI family DNA-binding transcriptional regulator n=1 Tax=Geminisphaera colitermitum TaxID=1148786 RepID=UPI000158D3BD|nr:LacI family DNA-binding transcriptional regulator [Geminisphaera colitermitum]
MINIRELASLANVSPSAVSIALRGRTGISEETRHRILKLATQHGYRPNPMVSALMSQVGTRLRRRVESIVGILSYMDLAHYPVHSTPHLYLQGINHAAEGAGYLVENFTLANDGHGSVPLARMLDARCIRGLIVHVKQVDFDQIALDRNRFAFVALGVPVKGDAVDFVCNDHGHSVQLAIRNLRRLGYRRLGLALDGNRPEHAESAMLSAMLLEQYRAGEKHTIPPLLSKDWGPEIFLAWYRRGKPDAIICSDHLALDWLRDAGVRVPGGRHGGNRGGVQDSVAFAHIDLDPGWKGIAGIDQCNDQVGAAAMDLLISLLNANRYGLPAHPRTVKLQGEWHDGDTAPPCAAGAGG